jgi:hypothetical protein
MNRTSRLTRLGVVAATAVTSVAFLVPMSTDVPAASAAGSAFCTAVFSWAEHPVVGPTALTISGYRQWVKLSLPYYEKMEATAPNAQTKEVLGFVVTVLTNYSNFTSLPKLAAYEKLHHAAFEKDVKALAAAIKDCATSGTITLP